MSIQDPIREVVIAAAVAKVVAMAEPTYSFTPKSVFREVPNIADLINKVELHPAVFVFTGGKKNDFGRDNDNPEFVDNVSNYLDLNVMFIGNQVNEDLETVGARMEASLEKCLTALNWNVDYYGDGIVVQMFPIGGVVWNGFGNPAHPGGHSVFRVKYRTWLGDPFRRP
jgi:hypothetical protein